MVSAVQSVSPAGCFQEQGYFLSRRLIAPAEVQEIRDTFMTLAANGPIPGISDILTGAKPGDPLAFYPRMMNPHRHPEFPVGPLALRYLLDGRILALLRDFAGSDVWAAQSMFYFKPPGSRGQALHQDNFYLKVKPGTCLAAWIAIDDCDRENGAMEVVPGSHHLPTICPEQADAAHSFTTHFVRPPESMQPVMPVMQAGDVLFFNGQLIHGSTPNVSSSRFRRSLIFHYMPAGSVEIAGWYDALDSRGQRVASVKASTDGGPCGTPFEATAPH